MHPPSLLAKHIEMLGSTQADFARRAGIEESMLCHYLKGERRPGLKSARAIEKASNGAVPSDAWIDFKPRKRGARRAA